MINLRIINSQTITEAVKNMCMEANYILPCDIKKALENAEKNEESAVGKEILEKIIKNSEIAKNEKMPICQDTGMAVFFVEIGNKVHIEGKNLTDAINEGVRQGYTDGYLRKSVVSDPLIRNNTGDNTPAIIHYEFTDGENIKITIAPKGFGSENMSAIKMLAPSAGIEGIKAFVKETVEKAGANPCPPIVIGVGIGSDFEGVAQLAKKALTRSIDTHHPDKLYADLEDELLKIVNKTGIGPQGFGGRTTAIGLNIETAPTHIASLPCAVNISCHVTRHLTKTI